MSRGVQAFKQTDVTKAIKAALNAGLSVQRYEVDQTGKIAIIIGNPDAGSSASDGEAVLANGEEPNEWDNVK